MEIDIKTGDEKNEKVDNAGTPQNLESISNSDKLKVPTEPEKDGPDIAAKQVEIAEVKAFPTESEDNKKDITNNAQRDINAPGSDIDKFIVNNFYGWKAESKLSSKSLVEELDITRWQISNDILGIDRETYLERPGFSEALTNLSKKHRLLLLTGPEGCGLHTSVKALSYDLYKKHYTEKNKLKVYSFPHIIQSSPDLILREFSGLSGSILLFEDGLQTKQSFVVRLLSERGGAGVEYVNDQLRNNNSWIIITGPAEPINSVSRDIYNSLVAQKQLVELGMPDISELFKKITVQISGKSATEVTKFLFDKLPDALTSLRTSQDTDYFARTFFDIFSEYSDSDQIIQKAGSILKTIVNVQREVRKLFEEELVDSDIETLLAILLSTFDGYNSSLFWGIYDYVRDNLIPEEPSAVLNSAETKNDAKENVKEMPQPTKVRRIFGISRSSQLRMIHAEEVEIGESVNEEKVLIKKVRFVDHRYAAEILKYSRTNFESQLAKICDLLEKKFILNNQDVSIRMPMARVIAMLGQSNWDGAFIPIIYNWATNPDSKVRASVGYALEQVFRDNLYIGNLRNLLNQWCSDIVGGQEGWNLKWTVASACKSLGLTDISLGLEYLRKLATFVGQRDLRQAKSNEELIAMIFDSQIEGAFVFTAIQYTMVVFCIQGYIPQVIKELQKWSTESSDDTPLALIATLLFLGIFQEFVYLALEAKNAGISGQWEPTILQEWSIQVVSHSKKIYICNQVLQYLIQNKSDKDLFEAIANAMARTFVVSKQVKKHEIIYAIFFQWINELGQDNSNIDLRETVFMLHKLFISICRKLGPTYINDIYSFMDSAAVSQNFPRSIQEFAKGVCRDLNAPSLRYPSKSEKGQSYE
ncbi:MAG: hypothetical protein WBW94_00850 [Anaerolineales bacterium]